jgi:septal ring factor EnvC (AmiA/AmiB activator)
MTVEWIIGIILTALLGAFSWSLKRNITDHDDQFKQNRFDNDRQFKKLEAELKRLDDDIKSIKGNYLSRFSEAKDHTTSKISEVIEKITENKVKNLEEHSAILNAITEIKTIMCKKK